MPLPFLGFGSGSAAATAISTITKALKATDKDAKVQIDLATHRVQVEPVSADAEELAEAIKDAGYTPVPVEAAAGEAAPQKRGSCCGCR